jgi:hypothetical protein
VLKVFKAFDRQDTAIAKKKHYSTITAGLPTTTYSGFLDWLSTGAGLKKRGIKLRMQIPDTGASGDPEKIRQALFCFEIVPVQFYVRNISSNSSST